MFDAISVPSPDHRSLDPAFTKIRAFVQQHEMALQKAAALLARRHGAALAARIVADLSDASHLSRRCRRDLQELLDILGLENVDDLDREEAGCFAAINPASCIVEEICLLTDGLRDVLARADADERQGARAPAASR